MVFKRFETFTIVESAHAEDAIGGFGLECGDGSHNDKQVCVQIGVGQTKGRGRFPGAEIRQNVAQRSGAPVILKAKFLSEQVVFETGQLVGFS